MHKGSRMRSTWCATMMGVAGLALFAGCGGQESKEGLVPAYGTVTLDGEPLADAQVTFDHPDFPETFGRTDSDGYYEMAYTRSQEGAFIGENSVSFMTASEVAGKPERLPQRYLIGHSDMKADVQDGGGPYDFDLTSDEEAVAATSRK